MQGTKTYPHSVQPMRENFTDISALEVEAAIPVSDEKTLIAKLRQKTCSECNQPIEVKKYELRRSAPFLYNRITLHCVQGHEQKIVFRIDWFPGGLINP